ncbi:MAG: hypothetical protein J7K02_08165, partial [Deltaproteobacteria bacterium]|nr:hypothetical protein [Deltaproteobacteria bacterium]
MLVASMCYGKPLCQELLATEFLNKLGYLSGNKAQQGLHKVREHGYVFFCSMPLINRGHQRAP